MEGELLVTNIQRLCMHDGPGIRTTVFLKGCNLHCPWCANPENIHPAPEKYCRSGRAGEYGRYYTPAQLVRVLLKDRNYWGADGGVTFSGGEPLLRIRQLTEALEVLRSNGVHIAVETALQIDGGLLEAAMRLVDLFIVDIKILQPEECRSVLGGNVLQYRKNVGRLRQEQRAMLFRIPCNREYTVNSGNLELLKEFLARYPDIPVEIFATHSMGKEKYESMGLEFREFENIPDTELKEIAERLAEGGSRITINAV